MDNNMRENVNSDFIKTQGDEASLKDLILSMRDWVRYFWVKKIIIIIAGIAGAGLGFLYALNKKPVYTATTSFVLETGGKGSGLSAYAGLASSFGIDLGGAGSGLFEGDNILELYKSRNMISKALLSEGVFGNKKQLLIDRYIDFNKLRKNWEEKPELKNITFSSSNIYQDPRQQRLHDSIISRIVNIIDKNLLQVNKIDKKMNIINVRVICKDELFAKYFNEKLVENVNRFYLDTKTKKNLENVSILQTKTDSVRGILAGAINRAVAVADATPNQNPTRMAQREAPIQNARINAAVNEEVLGTLLQNLELSKISLLKEAPLIQIVDSPILPLPANRLGKLLGLIIGSFVAGILVLIYLFVRKSFKDILSSDC